MDPNKKRPLPASNSSPSPGKNDDKDKVQVKEEPSSSNSMTPISSGGVTSSTTAAASSATMNSPRGQPSAASGSSTSQGPTFVRSATSTLSTPPPPSAAAASSSASPAGQILRPGAAALAAAGNASTRKLACVLMNTCNPGTSSANVTIKKEPTDGLTKTPVKIKQEDITGSQMTRAPLAPVAINPFGNLATIMAQLQGHSRITIGTNELLSLLSRISPQQSTSSSASSASASSKTGYQPNGEDFLAFVSFNANRYYLSIYLEHLTIEALRGQLQECLQQEGGLPAGGRVDGLFLQVRPDVNVRLTNGPALRQLLGNEMIWEVVVQESTEDTKVINLTLIKAEHTATAANNTKR